MVCRNFILPEPASYVFFCAVFNLRKLLYIIQVDCRQRVHSIKQSVTVCIIAEVKCCFEHIPHKLHDPREHVRGMVPCTHGLSRSSVANVPRLLLLCAFLPARRFVAWNALRLADDGDALDAVIDKLVVPVLPQLRDDLVRQLFLQRSCIFNCHLESS